MAVDRRSMLRGSALAAATAALASVAGPASASSSSRLTKPRVLVSSDIGGTDLDDFQSMVHVLLCADRLDLEGLVSSPFGDGRASDIFTVIDAYERDFPNLRTYSRAYPTPKFLRGITSQGAIDIAGHTGLGQSTQGSRAIVRAARKKDVRPLNVLVWGGIEDLAQALHDAPDIKRKLRVYYIGGPNKLWCVNAYNYIETHHPDLFIIESNSTYRGFFTGGDQSGEWENTAFVNTHVAGHGALGDFYAGLGAGLKMGDTPSVVDLLHGGANPGKPGWGGQYVPIWDGRKSVFDRLTTAADVVEAYGVIEWVIQKPAGYSAQDTTRFVVDNRTGGPFPTGVPEGSKLRFRYSPRDARVMPIRVESTHPAFNGLTGGFTSAGPAAEKWTKRSRTHRNWWCDDQDPAVAEGVWPGAKTVSRWRVDYLTEFAAQMERCRTPRA